MTEEKREPYFYAEVNGEMKHNPNLDEIESVRVCNPDKENGYDETEGPLDWLNSAGVVLSPEDDAVYLKASLGDPRGAFVFTIRRLSDGRIVMHAPYPGEGMAHLETEPLHEGTLLVKY
jgi:hypothetical protein